ncbi:aspartate/glutamate racemase family protein [Sinobaca sp. H24]|uniref:aspartate/glutamate racemase family protein n=1 Tax=Sinobaca sp. H24 TaxID=2923376 RepID=UPI00207A3F8B|nr:aspartate/glutamate racemase family protein [Sinobaca sp. H24]
MKVVCVHALKSSLQPIEDAFQAVPEEVELHHMMDTTLLSLLKKQQTLSSSILFRFVEFCRRAEEEEADVILLTCSAFNEARDLIQPLTTVPVLRSDEGVMKQAAAYPRVGLISTVAETPPPLERYLKSLAPDVVIHTKLDTEAMDCLARGDKAGHDARIYQMVQDVQGEVDVIVLSQYSMTHTARHIPAGNTPVLTAADASVQHILGLQAEREAAGYGTN